MKRRKSFTHQQSSSDLKNPSTVSGRIKALEQLVSKDDAGVLEDLLQALQDKSPSVRSAAAEFLGDLNHKSAITPLIKTLSDRSSEVRMSAIRSLGTLLTGSKCPRQLIRMLEDPNVLVRIEAAESLGAIGDRKALPALWRAINDRSPLVRSYVAGAIGAFGRASDIPELEQRLKKESSDTVKIGIYQALYELGRKDMLPPLISLLMESGDYRVRIATATILAKVVLDKSNAPTILDALRRALKQEKTIAGKSAIRSNLKIVRRSTKSAQ
ncbi:MAG TPA: HEAT repeat domain-containing protein [Pyrinomonadaceae bacterium]|nr:HEAT repeat domain-containing protein [Pyrinomonadaceae bacterium]